ncbi:MAG: adenylate kinase [Gracilibacteraceae bacterium]|jgi:hypothetical protein|nr:adenylate kinase [Gracilibacteraceae bacterium]
MIILITGATHTGKTKLAQRLLEMYHYPYLSIDHLKMGLIRSGQTDLTPNDDIKLNEYLWPIVREIVKTAIENEQNLIVEGCYIPFDWKKDFKECNREFVRFICLAMTDAYIESHYEEILRHSCDIETRLDNSYCSRELLKRDNHFYIDGCVKNNLPLIIIDKDYESVIKNLTENKISVTLPFHS